MTRIHVVSDHNRSHYENQLQQYFMLRHDVFVTERGWVGLRQPDGVEKDAYDNANAVYLLAIDEGRVVGGQRLYPTLLPHMMSDVFAWLATRGVPRGATIMEWTRYFVVRERRTGRTDCRLLAGMQAFCLDAGIAEVTAVVEMWWLPRWQQVGFEVRPLGLPMLVGKEPCIAAAIAISENSLEKVRRLAGLSGPLLVRDPFATPVIERVPHVPA